MWFLTDETAIQCGHHGVVHVAASQRWVTVEGRPVLVAGDPVGKGITGCTMTATAPCTVTVAVHRGYSDLVRIDGAPVCLDSLAGPTSGAPPGFSVESVNQSLAAEEA